LNRDAKIMVLGAAGMVGSACVRRLKADGFRRILTPQRHLYDLTRQHRAEQCIREAKPDVIIMAAGLVGGIEANRLNQATFLHDNACMALNVIEAALQNRVDRLIYLGSACAYPLQQREMRESSLLTGPLEPTNAGYALAKSLGAELCRHYSNSYGVNYQCLMPCNLYGPGDNYTETGHAVAMLIRRFALAVQNNAPSVTVWGTGNPLREFLHVDDLASAIVCVLDQLGDLPLINIGPQHGVRIWRLVETIADVTGFTGDIYYDTSKPDGAPVKLLDASQIHAMGWRPKVQLRAGLEQVYQDTFGPAVAEVA
jgi:GDP-L-fucose synthase